MKETYRWIDKDKNIHEYRFTDGICDGFFSNDKLAFNYKGKPLTDIWKKNLPEAGFKRV